MKFRIYCLKVKTVGQVYFLYLFNLIVLIRLLSKMKDIYFTILSVYINCDNVLKL